MDDEDKEFEWELCKENVLPLRSGRNCSTLNAVLQPTTECQQSLLKSEKHDFELELRTYSGDDPLDVWDRYTKWIERTFPSRGAGGKFIELLQNFLREFKDDARYTNDARYINWWIKFANNCDDPLEIYSYMFDNALGCDLSCFYEAWTATLEQVGNIQKADAIYKEGYKRIKEPPAKLEVKYQEFQARVANGTIQQNTDIEDDNPPEERTALGQLKGHGKRQKVGTNRVGDAKQSSRGGLGIRPQPLQTQNQGFQIYNENAEPSLVPVQTGEWQTLPTRKQVNRENELQPGPWKTKLPQRPGSVSSNNGGQQPSFKVHVEADDTLVTPRKGPVVDNNVLSARKPSKSSADPLNAIRTNTQGAIDQVPAYCKSKIYTGTEEFCFEELRAARYMKEKKEKMKLEEEKRKIQAEKEELARMREELNQYHLTMREELQQERQQIRQDILSQLQSNVQSSSSSQASSVPQQSLPNPSQDRTSSQRPVPVVNDNRFSIVPPGSLDNSREQAVTKQLNFDEMTVSTTDLNMASGVQGNRSLNPNSSQVTPNLSTHSASTTFSAGSRHHVSLPTPDSDSLYRRHGMTAPSPTVHTKEALQVVMGMFNSSLHVDPHWTDLSEKMEGVEEVQEPPKVEAAPFKIYDETSEGNNEPIPPPLSVYVDKENMEYQIPLESKVKNIKKKPLGLCTTESVVNSEIPTDRSLPKPNIQDNPSQHCYVYEEKMDDLEDDFTMASVGFSATARLASTPYNLSSDVKTLFAPPLSTIKYTDNTILDTQHNNANQSAQNTSLKQPSISQEKTLDIHMNTPSKMKLSPIMEGSTEGGSSDESTKSQASSLASRNYNQSHTLHTSHGLSRNTTQGLPSITEHSTSSVAPLHFRLDDHDMETPLSQTASKTQDSNHLLKRNGAQPVLDLEKMQTDVFEDEAPPPPEMEDATDQHVIDISCYVHPDNDDKTEALLLTSVKDPFDPNTIRDILSNLIPPLKSDPSYIDCSMLPVPDMKSNNYVDFGGETYQVVSKIAEGGYAKIYKGLYMDEDFLESENTMGPSTNVVLKVQKPSCLWEFYICKEIEKRMKKLNDPLNVTDSILTVKKGYFFHNGSCLVQDYYPQGTLLNLVNTLKLSPSLSMADLEPFVTYITIELLHMINNLHQCQIIHGDIKPDNFLLQNIPNITVSHDKLKVFDKYTKVLKLIDYGQAIDMTQFPKGTVFLAKVDTDGFKCIEMRTDQPWTYQTDLFGVIGTIHVLIFGKYMNVYQSKGKWHAASSIHRKWNQRLWKELFDTLLNIPNCEELPNLSALRLKFEDYFMRDLVSKYNQVADSIRTEMLLKS